jgi:hypothetical protein
VGAYGSLLTSQLDGIAAACDQLKTTFGDLAQPKNWSVTYAINDLQLSAVQSRADILRKSIPIIIYRVATIVSVSDVAKTLYGDTSRGGEILQLNALDNPFAIPANTNLRVYAA